MQKKPFFYGWYIVAAAFLTMMVTVGLTLYNLPFFYEFFIDEFGWTDTQATRGFLIGTLLVLPFGGFLVHRFSARKLIVVGALLQMLAFNSFGLMGGSLFLYYLVWCALMAGLSLLRPDSPSGDLVAMVSPQPGHRILVWRISAWDSAGPSRRSMWRCH